MRYVSDHAVFEGEKEETDPWSLFYQSAIISQLSSTTLQLPAISNVDWRAGGFIIAALLFSVLAVMLSCVQQQVLGTLNEPGGIRMWLSNGSGGKTRSETGSGSGSRRDDDRGGLQTSVASLLLLKLPNALLLYAVACFLVGFGLFLGLAWRQDLENTPSRDSNFAVMVLYIVVGCVTFFGSGALLKWKMSEVDQAENVIGKDIEEGHADHETGDGHGNSDDDDDDDSNKGENHRLLGKAKGSRKFSSKEVRDHEKIAEAMEEAAKAHRELAKLMSNALQGRGDS